MSNLEGATFILRTCDLPSFASGSNQAGSSNNASHSSFTWNNIDLKSILGDLWDKYDFFNISLVSNISSTGNPTFNSTADRLGIVYMAGGSFKWQNCRYDTGTKSFTNNACIGFVNFSSLTTAIGTTVQYNRNSINTFSKGVPIGSINISYNRVSDNQPNTTISLTLPAMVFTFSVWGIPRDDMNNKDNVKEIMDKRIKI